jgi:pimeloyl-ACP methyl ester carboxylesterase
MAGLAADVIPLLDALGIQRTHVLGWSLGSAVAQELAIAHPERVAALVLYATWAHADAFQRAIFTTLRHTWETRDMAEILTAMAITLSPELMNAPSFPEVVSAILPTFPETQAQISTTIEQWEADLLHDTRDRLASITSPTLVIAGQQDLLTPASQGRAVADMIPKASIEVFGGPGSSHALVLERAEEFTPLVLGFLRDHPLSTTSGTTAPAIRQF